MEVLFLLTKSGKYISICINNGYKCVNLYKNKKHFNHKLHRLIAIHFIDNPNNLNIVDHIDGNILNNDINNLRWCSNKNNCENRKQIGKNNTSGFKGVFKNNNSWMAQIRNNKKNIYIGIYKDKIEAAKKYNEKAVELFSEFAKLNIIPDN